MSIYCTDEGTKDFFIVCWHVSRCVEIASLQLLTAADIVTGPKLTIIVSQANETTTWLQNESSLKAVHA